MKFLLKMFKGPIKRLILREIKSTKNRVFIRDAINKELDVPNLNEEEERRLLEKVLDAAVEAVTIAIERI